MIDIPKPSHVPDAPPRRAGRKERRMRLIDADALAKELMHEGLGYQYNRVINAPTVDAVPVIRCKDCKWWRKNPYRESSIFGLCFKHKDFAIATDNTDWCSWAEREEE